MRYSVEEVLPYRKLDEIARTRAAEYAAGEPYPHIVIDDLFEPAILDAILGEFPRPGDANWELHDVPEELKLQSKEAWRLPLFTRQFLYALNSAYFLNFLERLTGIPKLIGDPLFEGGGLHQITAGGKLAIHADFNKHSVYRLERRLNLLVYLNKDWHHSYGGHFELWDRSMTHMTKKVAPLFNRTVIFTTSSDSYHGHPDPLACPPDRSRKSVALYYYTNDGVSAGDSERHSTVFRSRPGEHWGPNARHIARDLTPPLLWRWLGHIRNDYLRRSR